MYRNICGCTLKNRKILSYSPGLVGLGTLYLLYTFDQNYFELICYYFELIKYKNEMTLCD